MLIMAHHQFIRFALNLSYDQYLMVYQGVAKNIFVVANDGRKVAFPAGKIQPFLTKQGINGNFEMELTAENKFVSIKKMN
jgi:hypothetical protein